MHYRLIMPAFPSDHCCADRKRRCLLLAILVVCTTTALSAQSGPATDTVVKNAVKPLHAKASLQPEVSIGVIEGAEEYLRIEIAYAASHEAALHLDDVLARRTRISIETPDRGTKSTQAVAELIAPSLGWDDERIANEVQSYADRVEAERRSQMQEDDLAADAARIAAPDTRAVAVGRALD